MFYSVCVFFVVVMVLSGCEFNSSSFSSRTGTAKNAVDDTPMEGVKVDAKCYEYYGFESSRLIKTTTKTSDKNGGFYFGINDITPCDYVFYSASKPNFTVMHSSVVDHSYASSDESTIFFSLRPNDTIRSYYIKIMAPEKKISNFIIKGGIKNGTEMKNHAGQFHYDYVRFKCARRAAKTPEQLLYIKQHYCELLVKRLELFEQSPNRDTYLNVSSHCPHIQGADFPENYAVRNTIDIDEVIDFCG